MQNHLSLTSHHLDHWTATAGLDVGVSGLRTTVSPLVGAGFHWNDLLKITSSFNYRDLRTDIPHAVAAGVLQDQAGLQWEYHPHWFWQERLLVTGSYTFRRSYSVSGASALTHEVDPVFSFIILKKPYLSVGYQYTFSQTDEHHGFFTEVPLIPKLSAHYLTGFIGDQLGKKLHWEGGFFIGQDTERHLDFLAGDLWGVSSGIRWALLPWLDFEGSYFFANETVQGVGGRTHQGRVGISYHWQ